MSDEAVKSAPPQQRLVSLDAFRGAIMLMMASAGLELASIASKFPDNKFLRFVGPQTDHANWAGCTLWDLIQPAFMFMVGVALPWSLANRRARGQGFGLMFGHALWRALVLVLLSIFLQSSSRGATDWTFPNVLAQIGLAYPFLFLVYYLRPRAQWVAAFAILFAYWLLFALYPLPPAGFDWPAVGAPEKWAHLEGFGAHWDKNFNAAAAFDHWFLNLFPREKPFLFNGGGYQTLNFVPSLGTMIFGLLAGRLLRGELAIVEKLKRLILAGIAGIAIGLALDLFGICPMIKRIWTPSFAIYSAGWVTLLLAGFVALIDWRGWKRGAFPLIVAGLNPITLYCLWQLSGGFIKDNFRRHLGAQIFESFGPVYTRSLERATVLLVMWLILYWMYRKKIFVKI